jgi:hypothetical protein
MSDIDQSAAGKAANQRYEALFRNSQTPISIRSSEELFSLLARELRPVVNFYVMGVGIYDEKAHEMHTTSYGEPGVPLQAPQFTPEETYTYGKIRIITPPDFCMSSGAFGRENKQTITIKENGPYSG